MITTMIIATPTGRALEPRKAVKRRLHRSCVGDTCVKCGHLSRTETIPVRDKRRVAECDRIREPVWSRPRFPGLKGRTSGVLKPTVPSRTAQPCGLATPPLKGQAEVGVDGT